MSALSSLTDASQTPRPFGRGLREAIRWMLIDATDLKLHLESADPYLVLYGGRRVDQAWRRVEHFAANWLRDDYQDTDRGLWARDSDRVAEAIRRLPLIPQVDAPAERWVICAREALQLAGDAIAGLEPDPHVVAVQMRTAREAFALYRLAKYRWIDQAVQPEDLAKLAYQALEA